MPPFLVRRPLLSRFGVLLEDTGSWTLKVRDVILESPTLAVCKCNSKKGTTELVYPVDVHRCIIHSRPNMGCLVIGRRVFAMQIVLKQGMVGGSGGIDKAVTFYASINKEREEWA